MPELSVIVTAYNIDAYIDECLESVLAQTLEDIEVIVVDDGSSDQTPQIIASWAERDSRVLPVFLPENSPGGIATAANTGLDRATGRWVGFVDGDDFIEPEMFERLVSAAVTHDADLAMCQYLEVDPDGLEREPADAHRWDELPGPALRLDLDTRKRLLRFVAVPWRKLYRRSLLEDNAIRFPVGDHFYEDNPFHWAVLAAATSIALVPDVLCRHRIGRAGQTMATADERLFRIFEHHATIHRRLQDTGVLEAYETALVAWVISQLEWISARTPPQLRRTLFDTLVPIFAQYQPAVVTRALAESNKGVTAQRLSTALVKQEYGSFARVLATRPGTGNPLVAAAFHLRHSGVRHTAVITTRYLRNRVTGSPAALLTSRISLRSSKHDDVMFGLMALQQQLTIIDERLGAIESRVSARPVEEQATSDRSEQRRYGLVIGEGRHDSPSGG